MLLFHFYGQLYVHLGYMILEYLQVLKQKLKIKGKNKK